MKTLKIIYNSFIVKAIALFRLGISMESYQDVKRFLLKFGIIIYIGNKHTEIELSLIEIEAL